MDAHAGRLTPHRCDPQAERDEHDAGDRFERAAHALAGEQPPRAGGGHRVAREPDAVSREKTSPSASSVANAEPNCGSRLVKKTTIFGLARLLTSPCRSEPPGVEAAAATGAGRRRRAAASSDCRPR